VSPPAGAGPPRAATPPLIGLSQHLLAALASEMDSLSQLLAWSSME
jgi:hypothetical protein